MSVRTDADEALENARDRVTWALRDLGKIVIERCYGHDDFRDDFKADLKDAYRLLLDARDKLGGD